MKVAAFYTNSGVPVTGLSPTIRIRDLDDNSLVVTDDSMTEVGDGHYQYNFSAYDADKDYVIRCDAGATLSDSDRYKYSGNENYINDIENSNLSTQILGVSADVGDIQTDVTQIINDIDTVNTNVLGVSASVDEVNTNLLDSDTNILGISADIQRLNFYQLPLSV